jgi:2-polyprenyl-3-methyl-5-hydroxy-6-metoxy-1,4-benzoquinol methylase
MIKLSQKEVRKEHPAFQYLYTVELGPWISYKLLNDPLHMVFVLSRYKFAARMTAGKKKILEVGCGDAFGTPIIAQYRKRLLAVDIDDRIIQSNKKRLARIKNIEFRTLDFRTNPPREKFDAVISIDVIEHIDNGLNDVFMQNSCRCLFDDGICLVGTPNIAAEKYSSPQSKKYHVNLQSHETLQGLIARYFTNVLMFSMNDEVVHTGFAPMAHYLFGIGIGPKRA